MQFESCPLTDLYQEVILDHFRRPRHFHKMEGCDICQPGKNPLCGDELSLFLRKDDAGRFQASFEGHGCSISKASASIMVDAINGKTEAEIAPVIARFYELIRNDGSLVMPEELDSDLDALAGVRQFPVRIKCASLAWKSLELAFKELQSGRKIVAAPATTDDMPQTERTTISAKG